MKKILLLVALVLFTFSLMLSQNSGLSGRITDSENNPLPGISIFVKASQKGTYTNSQGKFILENLNEGDYVILISGIGFDTEEIKVIVEEGKNPVVDLSLKESISALGEVVITGGNSGIKEIPGSAQYISPKELEKFSYTDINRALKSVPGVNIQEEDGFGLRPNIGLRASGVDRSSKITVMEDGILVAPAPYIAPAAYYFPTMGRMQGIEIMKGNAQIKYGPYTTGGAINLISGQIPTTLSGKINALYGSFNTHQLHAKIGNSHKNVGYMIETFQYGSQGFKELDGGGNTGFTKSDYQSKLSFNTNENAKVYQAVTFKFGFAEEDGNETYLGLTDDDFNNNPNRRYVGSQKDNISTTHTQMALTHLAKFSEKLNITTSVYNNTFKRNWYKVDKVKDAEGNSMGIADILENPVENEKVFNLIKGGNTTEDERLFVIANNRSYYSRGIQSALKYNIKKEKVAHSVEIGSRLHRDQVDRFQWDDQYEIANGTMALTKEGIPGTESNRIEWANAFAVYGTYRISIGKISLSPGIRYEYMELNNFDYGKNDVDRTASSLTENKNIVDVFLPGIGLNYSLSKKQSLFAGYHKGFAPPGTTEETLPEESDNFEVGYRYSSSALAVQTVLFYNDYKNLLGADLTASGGTGSNELFNGGAAKSYGIEFQINYDILNNSTTELRMPVQLSYTYTDAEFLTSFASEFEGWETVNEGDELPYLAHNQLSMTLGIEYSRFSFSINGRYMDAMRTEPGQGAISEKQRTDSYFVSDLSASFLVRKYISVFTNVLNISDEKYIVARRPAGLRPGIPRAINAGIKLLF